MKVLRELLTLSWSAFFVVTILTCDVESMTTPGQPTYPNIPSPYTELAMGTGMNAMDATMTMSCLNKYTSQFRQTLTSQLDRAKQEMLSTNTFCVGATDVLLATAYVNMMSLGVQVLLDFGVDVVAYGTDTLSGVETCSWQLGSYLSNFNNWRQPIWLDIYQCPRLVFTSSQFNLTEVAWQCPPQS